MNRKVKTAIAGFGRSDSDIHARYLKTDPRFEVVAVADELDDRRADAVKAFGCKTFHNAKELIAAGGFELLVNATPNRFHVETSLAGLQAGFHVLSEAPSATTVAEFDAITAAAEKADKLFFPFLNFRFYPYFRKIREVIASRVLGRIICIRSNWSGYGRRRDWQTRQDQCAGNLFNTGPHPEDQAIVLFGDATRIFPPESTTTFTTYCAQRIITLNQVRRQIYVMEEAHRQNPLPRIELN